jgi:hypothetical protein
MGRFKFAQTDQGQKAEGMVARSEIAGISAGYRVEDWQISDADGKVLDPDADRMRWDEDLTFTATRWQLFEASLVGVPADGTAMVRSLGSGKDRAVPRSMKWRAAQSRSPSAFGDLKSPMSIPRDFTDQRHPGAHAARQAMHRTFHLTTSLQPSKAAATRP